MKRIAFCAILTVFFGLSTTCFAGPCSPAPKGPNDTNSIAIYYEKIPDCNDPSSWATEITIERGYNKIDEPGKGFAFYGDDANALGKAGLNVNHVVSLGDGGIATLTFDNSIYITNGDGFDFAVFENAFSDTFLELALVEVSSDGVNFFGFDCVSLTPTNRQQSPFGLLDTTNLHNLAGKFKVGYGTPFDLEELRDVNELIDVNSITHIRIIDVVGYVEPVDFYGDGIVDFIDYSILAAAYMSKTGDDNWNQNCDIAISPNDIIDYDDFQVFTSKWLDENEFSSCDSNGHQINDPWPTNFEQGWGGFDLDAVGIINERPR